ncbi:CDP-glycerol glycerophosphotransferase family protein [Porcipelethomonas ammoniilytica]|jgi:CDP-glycerol glycerophosphotransferase (TagB/SpsB family)|uniref:CDP-glycerol glycerophosphotransferase family protein n=1 Tax=Porcipelethomonas ammoniilytica TaxID=2981722 RepID=UPI000820D801|nr:CDP-glycerol glycerophosphotransferase family protein [Porcipelethomonas ammoniilytica]MCU6719251.1 CDP-glycerol glycerophosphotransferase family protein [Porcipelethomonas ammoniilytica]MEE0186410.1 CDP-glycerol glycerophosphotransferase family protein [Oscillospiraceae bacterium]OLA69924.1 MAG: hypothetical protein BHW52_07635 [Ruminococcus sp. 37_24]SCI74574.1 CDP-glycerol:poly(glycerophosphate) glycerophosphotransferase [uncultured Ruminococcus sp.]
MSLLQKIPRKVWRFLDIINRLIKKDKESIFIYSNLGFRDNIKAIFDYLIENKYNSEFRITVSLNNYEEYEKTYQNLNIPNIKFVSNLKGVFSFFRCKYCFYCFGKYPIKPAPGQVVFNLWHGMPLKRIGNMVKGCEKVNYNYFTHLLCTSEFFRDIMKKSFNCSDNEIVICGQPRTDNMLNSQAPVKEREIKARIISFNERKNKMILWLPTFREKSADEFDILSKEQLESLNQMCINRKYTVVIKPHPLSSFKAEDFNDYKGIKIITDQRLDSLGINFYSVIRYSECLITDYSSVYFDYMLLDKPIGFVVSDISEYDSQRGFVFDNPVDFMPGDIITSGDELLKFAEDIINHRDNYKEQRQTLCRIFNTYDDAQNCKRVLEAAGIRLVGKLY